MPKHTKNLFVGILLAFLALAIVFRIDAQTSSGPASLIRLSRK